MIAGTLEIQLLANMARLQSDMDKAKRTVSGTVDAMNKVLSTIGVGISIVGITNLIRSTADAADKMRDLKIASGLAIEQIGGLGKAASMNGSNIDQVARAVGIMSQKMYTGSDAFKVLGVEVQNSSGNLRDSGQVLLDISDKFASMEDGATKSAIANEIFGKSGRDLIPTLNQGRSELESLISSYARHSGMTQKLADDSDRFNDILYLLGERVTGLKNTFVGEILPTLNSIGNAMLSTGQSTNQFSFAVSVVVPVLKGLAIAGFTVADTFRGMGREIGARAAQLEALTRLDFKGMAFIGKSLAEDNAKARAEYDKLIDTIMNGDKVVQKANVSQQKMLDLQIQMPTATDAATKSIEKQTKAYDIEIYKLKQYEDMHKKGRDLTSSVATEQERYNNTLEELESLKPYITVETYNRALEKAQKQLKGTEVQTRATTDEVSQLWIQAGRNIQSSIANSIFNFFDDGLKGMVKNVGIAVGRIASEFAALKIAQGIGLAGMFGGVSGAAVAGGGGGGSVLGGALSLGGNALSLAGGGFGSVGAVGSLLSMAPGQLGSFGVGMASGGGAGMSAAAGLGASFASVAGPAMALFAVDAIGRALAGDRKLGGAEYIPVLGGFLAAMFGREPYKFRQQSLQGTVSSEGFDGNIANVFRSKGGLFSSNKHKTVIEELSRDQQLAFDTAIGVFYNSASGFAENLGLPASLIDDYTTQIQIKSNKGGKLKEEAIAEMLAGIGDGLAKNVIPNIEEMARVGERAFDTLSRLNTEFVGLAGGAVNLGASIEYAKELIKSMSFESRESLISMAGGLEGLAAMTSSFNQHFLTEQERMLPVIETLNAGLKELGVSTDITKEQFKELVQDVGISSEKRIALLKLEDELFAVRTAAEKTAAVVVGATITSTPNYYSSKIPSYETSGSQSEDYTGFATRADFTRAAAKNADTLRRQKAVAENKMKEIDILNGIVDHVKNSAYYARQTADLLMRVTRDGDSLVTTSA